MNTDSETIGISIPLGPPVLAPIGNKTVVAGKTLTFTASATDPNPGDTLTYSLDAASLALGMKIDPNSGAFKWTPGLTQAGKTFTVTVTVTDGSGLTDSETIKIAVQKAIAIRSIKLP